MSDCSIPRELTLQLHSSFFQALQNALLAWSIKCSLNAPIVLRLLGQWWKKGPNAPDLIETYTCRPSLPIRIFFPKGYERNSKVPLPTLFVIHGGGFLFGHPSDDDPVNRRVADTHKLLVIELNYRKAPSSPFPTALHDLEAILLAIYVDIDKPSVDASTLPIDKSRVAFSGFSAGGCLALGVCQLPKIKEIVAPSAVIPVYPVVDHSIATSERLRRRHYKTSFAGLRGDTTDFLSAISPSATWSYVPYGQDLRDPLLSPFYAKREDLPKGVFIVGAELDQLCHEAWRLACRLGGKRVPADSAQEKPGRREPGTDAGKLEVSGGDERFYWEHDKKGKSERWLLVPDALHAYNLLPLSMYGDQAAMQDGTEKAIAVEKMMAEWLNNVIWKK